MFYPRLRERRPGGGDKIIGVANLLKARSGKNLNPALEEAHQLHMVTQQNKTVSWMVHCSLPSPCADGLFLFHPLLAERRAKTFGLLLFGHLDRKLPLVFPFTSGKVFTPRAWLEVLSWTVSHTLRLI